MILLKLMGDTVSLIMCYKDNQLVSVIQDRDTKLEVQNRLGRSAKLLDAFVVTESHIEYQVLTAKSKGILNCLDFLESLEFTAV